ncbi:MAG TPA: universal stress protein [Gammaproteobacteria bacterium]|nr:universal stress protein [Gammaproteobacteria bacterium]
MRLILVPTADRPESVLALDTAFALAERIGANVAGCHVRGERFEPSSREVRLMPDVVYGKSIAVLPSTSLTSRSARKAYVRTAARHGFDFARRARVGQRRRAFWHELVGTPARMFAIAGPIADLAVLARPKPKSAGRATAFLLAAVLHSARPVLVVPQKPLTTVGNRILVAWNQSAEAALAVSAAIPLLQQAKQVVVVSSGPENRAGPKSSHLAQYLANWDVRIDRLATRGRSVEKEIEGAYRETESDLLVMGAYSRHRLRQLIFGGVTEHMLFNADMPVLMLHR